MHLILDRDALIPYGREAFSSSEERIAPLSHEFFFRSVSPFSVGKTYVHQYGRGVGFGAETLGLIEASLHCLSKNTRFTLGQQQPKGFSVDKGWEDYFQPFWPQTRGLLLSALNRKTFPLCRIPLAHLASRFLRTKLYPRHAFMFDDKGPADEAQLVKLGFAADYWERMSQFCEMLFVYRPKVEDLISAYLSKLLPTGPFVAVHVRRGDKITESPYVPLGAYVKAIREADVGWPVYVASDDQRVLNELRDLLPDRQWIRAQDSMRAGYDQMAFNAADPIRRFDETVTFLAELEVMVKASTFIGASPSNVFFLTRYRRGNRDVVDLGLPY